jgi:hypothetical protein
MIRFSCFSVALQMVLLVTATADSTRLSVVEAAYTRDPILSLALDRRLDWRANSSNKRSQRVYRRNEQAPGLL